MRVCSREDVPVRSQLKAFAFLLVGLGLIVTPFLIYGIVTRPDNSSLFSHLQGRRTPAGALIIDPAHGTFAGLQLGMPFAAAQKLLPANKRCTSSPPADLSYCDGAGLIVSIIASCALQVQTATPCPAGSQTGPLGEIDIEATLGYSAPNIGYKIKVAIPDSQKAVTSNGLHFGATLKTLSQNYRITSKARFGRSGCNGFGTEYVALIGPNTAAFDVEGNALVMISLFAGREPLVCSL